MKLVSMKRTPKEKKEEAKEYTSPDDADYPWGLCLRLEEDELEKLGVDSVPTVGSTLRIECEVLVSSVSINDSIMYPGGKCVSLQVTAMALDTDDEDSKRVNAASKMYDKA